MPRLAIDREFLQDYTRLDKPVQALVNDVFGKFEAATHTGIHLEPVQNAKDKRFRTIRVNQFWRGVVLAPQTGDVYTLLKVLPHDDAYAWASRRRASVNAASGRIELRDVAAIDATLPALEQAAVTAPQRLFDHVKDADLRRLGLDDQTLAFARALTHEIQLDAAKAFLPERQWDVLAVLRRPFELWRVYLHPAQQEVVDARYTGPARVTGGPGTGKTVVAMHRARRLAERLIADGVPADGPKVLLTTFTSTLVQTLHAGLLLLTDDSDVLDRIDVLNIDRVARAVYVAEHGTFAPISDPEQQDLWRVVVAETGVPAESR